MCCNGTYRGREIEYGDKFVSICVLDRDDGSVLKSVLFDTVAINQVFPLCLYKMASVSEELKI